jgi:hypothetical protein
MDKCNQYSRYLIDCHYLDYKKIIIVSYFKTLNLTHKIFLLNKIYSKKCTYLFLFINRQSNEQSLINKI